MTNPVEGSMTEPDDLTDLVHPGNRDHVRHIKAAFNAEGKEIDHISTDGLVDHLRAKGEIVVREEYLPRVRDLLELPDDAGVERVIEGVVLLTLDEPHADVGEALELVDERLGRGIATPNHVLTASGVVGGCPATEPEVVYEGTEPYPSVSPGDGGAGVLIYLADTGLLRDAATGHPWLAGVRTEDPEPEPAKNKDMDPAKPLRGNPPQLPPYVGHGTFVAGVMRCMAPAADVVVANAVSIAGSHLESNLVRRLDEALGAGVDIFHLTIASPTRNDLPLLAFRPWLRHLQDYGGAVCIAPAGNEDGPRPNWPAAFSDVIGVGALGGDWRGRASFSNFGGWVDVFAPGRDLVNAYATGRYTCTVAPYTGEKRDFYGMAKWSGTSFSTPIVTGLIAARMSRTGENARQAAAALLAEARAQAIPGLGAVLLPGHGSGGNPGGCCCHGHGHGPHPA
jgi:subtilisin family serine protease